MTGRSRHGMHVVKVGAAPVAGPVTADPPRRGKRASVSLHLSTVVLAVAGRLTADTAGRLRMFLSMFTVDGGPQELVLDLLDVSAVDGDGMAPILEAAEALNLRAASLRLTSASPEVAQFLDTRGYRTLVPDRPSLVPGGSGARPGDDDPGLWPGLR